MAASGYCPCRQRRQSACECTAYARQFDVLVDFTFNLGSGALVKSTMLAKLNAGDYDGAAAEFEKWDHAAGKFVAGTASPKNGGKGGIRIWELT